MAVGFNSNKLDVHIGDGCEFMRLHQNKFDLIITDCSDPAGPGESLVTEEYFSLVKNALRPNGIHITHEDGPWLHQCQDHNKYKLCKNSFPSVGYCYASIPTYPSGELGFILCSTSLVRSIYIVGSKSVVISPWQRPSSSEVQLSI
jgi:spermidine synthase